METTDAAARQSSTEKPEKPMTKPFTMTRRVQFAETDMAGVLHFANYFRYMEEAEHAFWRSMGTSVITRHGDQEISWPRVSVACEYFAPARFEDELALTLTVTHVGERSVTFEIEFRIGSTRTALGRLTAVCCDTTPGHFKSTVIPDTLRRSLSQATGGS